MANVFVTGSTSGVGQRLLKELERSRYDRVYCLSRKANGLSADLPANGKFLPVQGSLFDHLSYADALATCETVVHLAAATGKAPYDDYFTVNAQGVEFLLDQCQQAGVKNFLHVSSIAVKYPNHSQYPYAHSKALGEKAVQQSQLAYAIVRPTIIVGEQSAPWNGLMRIARAPLVPLFANGTTSIQPISVDDFIACLMTILERDMFKGDIYELGGPEKITFQRMLGMIHRAYVDRDARFIRMPIKPIMRVLAAVEKPFHAILPLTAGQLSVFANDGTIESNSLFRDHSDDMMTVNSMLDHVIELHREKTQHQSLDQECGAFTKHLIGEAPTDYVLKQYRRGHAQATSLMLPEPSRFDLLMLSLSTKSPSLTKLVDAYMSLFRKDSIVRKKIILTMAILESCPPAHSRFEAPYGPNLLGLIFRLLRRGISSSIAAVAAVLLFAPLQASYSVIGTFVGKAKRLWAES